MLPFKWDGMAQILYEESRLSEGDARAIGWTSLKEASDVDIHMQFPEAGSGVLVVMKRDKLSNLQWLSKVLLFKIKAKTVDIKVEVKQDTPLMPAATDILQQIPFAPRKVVICPGLLWSLEGMRELPILWRSHGLLTRGLLPNTSC